MYNRYISRSAPEPVEEPGRGERVEQNPPREPVPGGLLERVRALFSRVREGERSWLDRIPLLENLDSGDILLIVVLIFLFRESDDEEWLIILALVLLMGL